MCSLHALLSRGKGRPENALVVVEVGGPQVGSRRFVDTALLRGLRLAAAAKRDGQTYHVLPDPAHSSANRGSCTDIYAPTTSTFPRISGTPGNPPGRGSTSRSSSSAWLRTPG